MANAVIGAEIRLDGERDFKRAVSSINTDIKLLGSEMKKVESEYKDNADSLSALTAKSEQYNKMAEAQRKKVEVLQTAVEKSRAKYTEAGQNVEKYRKELSDAQSELDRVKNAEGATTEEIQKQEEAVAKLSKKLDAAERSYNTAEKQTKRWETSLNNAEAELNDTQRELDDTNRKLREMGESSRYSAEQIRNAESTLGEFGKKAQPVANAAKAAFKAVTAVTVAAATASGAVIKKSVDIGGEFESQMSKVKAVSGATADEMKALTDKAKEMGGTTKFTAKQAGEALEYMSMAGWKTADMLGGIEGVMNLAAASGEDLGKTSDIVTDALTAFGMKAGDAGHFADVLAAASSSANTNVGMMGETFKYVGAMAGTLGYSAEDVGLSIGLMANAGIKASQAGTELNAIYTRLSVNTSHARDAIEGLGIQFYDANGKARSWGTILDEMRIKTAKMTDAEKTAFANRVAGQRAQAGLLAMLNATSADYDKLTSSIKNADGAAKRMADTMQDNLSGQLTVLKSGLEGTAITIYEEMQKPLTEGVKTAVSALNDPRIQNGVKTVGKQFGEMFAGVAKFAAKHAPDFIKGFQKVTAYLSGSSFKNTVKSGGELLGSIGKVALETGKVALPAVVKGVELLTKSGKVLVPVLAAGYAGFKAFQIVKTVTELVQGASGAFQALNVVMMANPWALAIGGIAAVTVALVALTAAGKDTENQYADLDDQLEKTAVSMQDMEQSRKDSYNSSFSEIYQIEKLKDRLHDLVDENGNVIGSKKELKSVTDKLNENGFKVELNKTGDLITNYQELNKEIDNYIQKKQLQAKFDSLDPEYKKYSVEQDNMHKATNDARKAYQNERDAFMERWGVDPDELITEDGYLSEKFDEGLKKNISWRFFGEEIAEQAKAVHDRKQTLKEYAKQEGEALDLVRAVEEAYAKQGAGDLTGANKRLEQYLNDRHALWKSYENYEATQKKQAIKDLGEQLNDEFATYQVALDIGGQSLIDKSLSQMQKAADELAKAGVKIPDGLIEGIQSGEISVEEAIQTINRLVFNETKVDLFENGKEATESFAEGQSSALPGVQEQANETVDMTIGAFSSRVAKDQAKAAGEGLTDNYAGGIDGNVETVTEASQAVTDAAVSPMGSPTPISSAGSYGRLMAGAYAGGIDSGQGQAKASGTGLAGASVEGMSSAEEEAKLRGTLTGGSFNAAIDSMKPAANAAGKGVSTSAVNALGSAESRASSAGKSLGTAFADGIPKGINIKLPAIVSSAIAAVNTAMNAAKKAAGINSPSKKTRDLIGRPLAEGVAVGFEKGAPDAARKAAAATNAMLEKMRVSAASAAARLSDNGTSGGFGQGGAAGSVNKTIHITYDNHFNGASARDGEALLRQLDRALGAKI